MFGFIKMRDNLNIAKRSHFKVLQSRAAFLYTKQDKWYCKVGQVLQKGAVQST